MKVTDRGVTQCDVRNDGEQRSDLPGDYPLPHGPTFPFVPSPTHRCPQYRHLHERSSLAGVEHRPESATGSYGPPSAQVTGMQEIPTELGQNSKNKAYDDQYFVFYNLSIRVFRSGTHHPLVVTSISDQQASRQGHPHLASSLFY